MARAEVTARDRMLDGLRGIAIVLVLLSHSWTVAPTTDWPRFSWLFFSGDFAVTIFFVISGFLAARGLLRELEATGRTRPLVTWFRRWFRMSAHVYPMVLVIIALAAITPSVQEAYAGTDTRESAWRIMTYTWSGYLRTEAAEARPDFGHLWYVCTDLWGIAVVLVVFFLLGRWRSALFVTLAALIVLVIAYRQHVVDTEGEFIALVRVQTRMDGLLWGALAAVALPWTLRLRRYATPALLISLAALVPLMGAVFDEAHYLGAWGTVLNADIAVLVIALNLATPPAFLSRTIGWTPWVTAGRYSLVLYLWHYPLFWYVAKLDTDWGWQIRALVACLLTLVAAVLTSLCIERPTQRWLRSEKWHALDRGVGPAAAAIVRGNRGEPAASHRMARHRTTGPPGLTAGDEPTDQAVDASSREESGV